MGTTPDLFGLSLPVPKTRSLVELPLPPPEPVEFRSIRREDKYRRAGIAVLPPLELQDSPVDSPGESPPSELIATGHQGVLLEDMEEAEATVVGPRNVGYGSLRQLLPIAPELHEFRPLGIPVVVFKGQSQPPSGERLGHKEALVIRPILQLHRKKGRESRNSALVGNLH